MDPGLVRRELSRPKPFAEMLNFDSSIQIHVLVETKSSSVSNGLSRESQGLKEFARQRVPALFQVLKFAARFKEDLDVKSSLRILARLNECSPQNLKTVSFLEHLVEKAGLHESSGAGVERDWPKELEKYTNKGLKIWQSPAQFSKYLCFLSQYNIQSYLEIGVAYGGTFVFTVGYLDRLRPGLKATCIDVCEPSLLIKRFAGYRSFQYITDKSCTLFQHLDPGTHFDLVLVDGDHSRQGAMSDFHLVRDRANIIAFHDIVNYKTLGAIEAWKEVKENYGDAFEFHEFIDQYDELMQANQGQSLFGIGVAVSKHLMP